MARRITTEDIERLLREAGRKPESLPPHGPGCLTMEEFVAFCEGRLAGNDLEKVLGHLDSCETCFDEVCSCLRELQGAQPEGEASQAAAPTSPKGCMAFLDLYQDVRGARKLSKEQQKHLASCGWCQSLRERLEHVLVQRRALSRGRARRFYASCPKCPRCSAKCWLSQKRP